MASGFGNVLRRIDAIPVSKKNLVTGAMESTNLAAGMLVVVPAVILGGIVLLAGARHLPREMALMTARSSKPRPRAGLDLLLRRAPARPTFPTHLKELSR